MKVFDQINQLLTRQQVCCLCVCRRGGKVVVMVVWCVRRLPSHRSCRSGTRLFLGSTPSTILELPGIGKQLMRFVGCVSERMINTMVVS